MTADDDVVVARLEDACGWYKDIRGRNVKREE